jgi:hypothetical protein
LFEGFLPEINDGNGEEKVSLLICVCVLTSNVSLGKVFPATIFCCGVLLLRYFNKLTNLLFLFNLIIINIKVAEAWAAWNFKEALGIKPSHYTSFTHYEPFYVVGVSDVETSCPSPSLPSSSSFSTSSSSTTTTTPAAADTAASTCLPTRACPGCSSGKEGIPCKTMCAFTVLMNEAPNAKW